MNTYHGDWRPIYNTPEGMRETSRVLIFQAENGVQAGERFVPYVINSFNDLAKYNNWLFVGSMLVRNYRVPCLSDEGHVDSTGICDRVLEWKCDMGLYVPRRGSPRLMLDLTTVKNLRFQPETKKGGS